MGRLLTQLGKSKVILSFIIGIGLVVGYLNYSGMDQPVVEQSTIQREDSLESFNTFSLDFSIFDDKSPFSSPVTDYRNLTSIVAIKS